MSDVALLIFGCAVTFIAASAVYVYLRGDFAAQEAPGEFDEQRVNFARSKSG